VVDIVNHHFDIDERSVARPDLQPQGTIMRSIIYESFGNPGDVLKVAERSEPGPGQIRIRTTLAAIHNHDLAAIRGVYGYRPALPAVGGTEATGMIDACGDGVELREGQRVAIFNTGVVWSEYVVVDAATAVPLPDAVNDEIGAQLISMPVSALALL
jgi:NADPH2:quinone reductase